MKIDDIIQKTIALRDEVQAAITEAKLEAPHLCNAAGHLAQAARNLTGHLEALANAAKAAQPAAPAVPAPAQAAAK